MYGYPTQIRTKADVQTLMGFLGTHWATEETKQRGIDDLQGLLDNRYSYEFDKTLGDTEHPDGSEPQYKVLVEHDEDTNTDTRTQYKRIDDPAAMIYQIGYTVAEVQSLISQIQETE